MAELDEWNEVNGRLEAHNRRFFPHPNDIAAVAARFKQSCR